MGDDTAERVRRGAVVSRKNGYGSGAVWAVERAAMLLGVFQTPCLWDIDPRAWPDAHPQGRAEAGGRAPVELAPFLPWQMSPERRRGWSLEKGDDPEDGS